MIIAVGFWLPQCLIDILMIAAIGLLLSQGLIDRGGRRHWICH